MNRHYNEERLSAYKIIETIGEGATSKVKLVEEIATQTKYAMKIMKPNPDIQKQIDREIEILKSFTAIDKNECPYLVNLHELIVTNKKIILVLNYVSGGDLEEKINNSPNGYLTESEAHFYFSELIQAIAFLHSKNITHRDLKLENLLIDGDGNLRLADFGLSIMSETDLSTHCGTPYYVAPEVFFNARYDGPPADVWSCGIVLYIMLCGHFPFEGKNFEDLGRKVMKGKVVYPSYLSSDVVDLISHILTVDIDQRYTIEQIKNHKWYKETPDTKPLRPTELDTFDNLLIAIDTENNQTNTNSSTKLTKNRKFNLNDSTSSDFESSSSQSDENDKDSSVKNQSNSIQIPSLNPQRLSSSSATANNENNEKKAINNNNNSSSSSIVIEVTKPKTVKPDFRTVKNRKMTMPRPAINMEASSKTVKVKTRHASDAHKSKIAVNFGSSLSMEKKASGVYIFELNEPVSDASQDTFNFLLQKKARFSSCPDSESNENNEKLDVKVKLSIFSKLKLIVEISNEGDEKDKSHVIVTLKKGRKASYKHFLFSMSSYIQESMSNRD